eukprot:sb/3478508/
MPRATFSFKKREEYRVSHCLCVTCDFGELSGGHFGCKNDIPCLANRQINRLKVKNTYSRNPTRVHVLKNSQIQSCSDHIASLIKVVGNCLAVILVPEILF